jgi:hypothetical protein
LEVNQDFINSIRKGNFIDIIPNYSKIIKHQINLSNVNDDITNAMVGYQVGRYFSKVLLKRRYLQYFD